MAGATLFCSRCGKPNNADAVFCSNCGAPQAPVALRSDQGPGSGSWQGSSPQYPAAAAPGQYQAYPPPPSQFHGYGGFWIRLLAFIIDWIVIMVVTWPLRLFAFGMFGLGHGFMYPRMYGPGFWFGAVGLFGIFRFLIGWVYWAGMESSGYQATVGKILLGMKVTDLAGNRIDFARASGRYFSKILSSILLIGFIMIGFTERKQGLHDMLAGTLVVKK
jgi:uncharacterized RDD family membrane protein YckC